MILTFSQNAYNIAQAVGKVKTLVNASTDLNYQQKSDCIEALDSIAGEGFEPGISYIDKSIKYVGAYGYEVFLTYFANDNYDKDILNAYAVSYTHLTLPTTSRV